MIMIIEAGLLIIIQNIKNIKTLNFIKMKNKNLLLIGSLAASMLFVNCSDDDAAQQIVDNSNPTEDVQEAVVLTEANLLLNSLPEAVRYNPANPALTAAEAAEANLFIPSVLGLDHRTSRSEAPEGPTVRFPLFQGWETPEGGEPRESYYIITESSDRAQAEALGIIWSPRMAEAIGGNGVQTSTWTEDGRLIFEGSVDFSPTRSLTVGGASDDGLLFGFPPAAVNPGAVADAQWSSYVELPSGVVINAQVMANSTGTHDRIPHGNGSPLENPDNLSNPNLDRDGGAVVLQLLDGWHDGRPYYFHIVTDTSRPGPAAIELGVLAPRLNEIPTFGLFPGGAMLPFSPTANGVVPEDPSNPEAAPFQGLNTASISNRQQNDPTNTFPIDPSSSQYSPMWDAHITEFTVPAADRVILTSFDQINDLLADGTLIPFRGNDPELPTQTNTLSDDLTPTGAIINCPVISQPGPNGINKIYGQPTN